MSIQPILDWLFGPHFFDVGTVLFIGIAIAMALSADPKDVSLALWFFGIAALLAAGRAGHWLVTDDSPPLPKPLLAALLFGGIGALWITAHLWVYKKLPAAGSVAEGQKADEKPPTLPELFKMGFPNTMKIDGNSWGLRKGGAQILTGPTKVYLDFDAKTKFIAFYVPKSEHSYAAALNLWSQVQITFESVQKQITVTAGYQQNMTDLKDLTFSGRVFLYHEDMFNLRQLADLVDVYKSHGMALDFRGPNFLMDQVMAWHHKHDPEAKK